ncbi:MBL fold metallo-hydrolase [Starkeya koreensis]|uniref:MBL fold metallo-hydrolase n=1 Tax=Ancylobacter koreensis TaxID=266121 RepID=A0ABT0DP46_9HYPH|nr:MBL fold metallo-hydrolase [Ancylobacter koreensis]MCK0208892.1 MBL fold metallo-hydrolase [Ancylobacter koreensis]
MSPFPTSPFPTPHLSRRHLMIGAAAAPLAAPLAGVAALSAASPAAAQTGSGQQVPGLYRYKVGTIEVTAVNDGARTFPLADGFVRNASREQVNAALEAAFQPKDVMSVQFNPLLINNGGKLTLIDTGNGPQPGNSSVGKLRANLAWAGVKPADIQTVVISHFHGDHINGLRAEDGGLAFPNAEILVPEVEWTFWTDEGEESRASEGLKANFQNVKRVFKDIDSKVTRYAWDKEIVPGLTSVEAAGHTPGHTAFVLASGEGKLFIQSDVTNTPILFAPNPQWQVQYDMDGEKATQTRRRIYDMVAADRLQLTGYHYPFPATGFIRKSGEGYEVVPAIWNPVL